MFNCSKCSIGRLSCNFHRWYRKRRKYLPVFGSYADFFYIYNARSMSRWKCTAYFILHLIAYIFASVLFNTVNCRLLIIIRWCLTQLMEFLLLKWSLYVVHKIYCFKMLFLTLSFSRIVPKAEMDSLWCILHRIYNLHYFNKSDMQVPSKAIHMTKIVLTAEKLPQCLSMNVRQSHYGSN